jgi:hypothetical protein
MGKRAGKRSRKKVENGSRRREAEEHLREKEEVQKEEKRRGIRPQKGKKLSFYSIFTSYDVKPNVKNDNSCIFK